MNEDLKNKIERLRGLLSTQAQMSEVPMAPVPPMMEEMMSGDPMLDESGEVMSDSCIIKTIMDGGRKPTTCPPPDKDGCCCFGSNPGGVMMEDACTNAGGVFQGAGVSCSPNPCGGMMNAKVPTLKDIFMKGLESLSREMPSEAPDSTMMG